MWSSRRPASERAVTIVSSSRGWRSTIAAASAPANPAAPRTATLCTKGTAELRELGLDRRTRAGHVFVGKGALRGAELEPQRERLAPLAHLLARVHVEQLRPVEQRRTGPPDGVLDFPSRQFLVDDKCNVLDQR